MKNRYNWNDIQKFYNNGGSYRKINKEYGISMSAIHKAVKRGDLKTRTKSEASKLARKLYPDKFKLTEETKKKISKSMIKYLKENPSKVPYLLNHSKNESYPEKYFNEIFKKEGFNFKRYHRIHLYELDFALLEKKICVEVDGEQHYVDQRIVNSDIKRTKFLTKKGWDVIRIRWSKYQKLNKKEKQKYIKSLFGYLNKIIKHKPTIKEKDKKICDCGSVKYYKSKKCQKCNSIKNRKVKRPPYKQLQEEINHLGYEGTGRKYNVSGNSIRKWVKFYTNI
jgi:very-short-patch-repair endonuclease